MRVEWKDDFKTLYKKRGQQKYGIRLFSLWKIQEGYTEKKVCSLIGKTAKTVRHWRKLYESGGVNKLLAIQSGRGRKPRLSNASILEEGLQELEKAKNGGRIRVQDIVNHLSQRHKIVYSVSGMYDALHRLGFSWVTGRSKHPKHNADEIENFKK